MFTSRHDVTSQASANKLRNRCCSLCMVNSVSTVWCIWDGVRGGVVIKRRGMYCFPWIVIGLVGRHCDSTNFDFRINAEPHISWVIRWGVFLAEPANRLGHLVELSVARKLRMYRTQQNEDTRGRAERDK